MATAKPITPAERDRIRDLHAAGKSCRGIAKDIGRSASAVAKVSRELGLTYKAERTAAATEAKQASNREKRATLETRLLDEAALLLDELHRPHHVYNFGGKDNTYAEETLPEPDIGGKRSLVQAASTAIDRAMKLAAIDQAAASAEAGKSILSGFFDALRGTDDEQPERAEPESEGQ